MKGVKYFVVSLVLLTQLTFAQETVTKDGKIYNVHTVASGETLYGISRKHNVTVDQINKANNNPKTLSIGQKLYIPTGKTAASTTTTHSASSAKPSPNTHIVQGGETLFRIAQKYGVSVDDVKAWNGLTSNGLSVGQKLLISKPSTTPDTRVKAQEITLADKEYETIEHIITEGETLYAIAAQYETTVTQIRKDNPELKDKGLQIGQAINIVRRPSNEQYLDHLTEPKKAVVPSSPYNDYERLTEKGRIVLTTDSKYESKFHYCLHKTAELGTLIKIVNTSTGKDVYARVMGHYPSTDSSILKVNKTVFQSLGGAGSTLSAEIHYRP